MPTVISSMHDWLLEQGVSYSFGGGDGVVRSYGSAGSVTAQAPVSLQVDVGSVGLWITNRWYTAPAGETGAGEIADPSTGVAPALRRIDLVVWTAGAGITVVTGVEGDVPVAPATPASSVVLAHVYCRKDMVSIKDADDASNGYIVDARDYF